jgi:hypothetical protein
MFVFMCLRAWLHSFQTAFKTKSAKCESQRRLSVVLVNAKALIKLVLFAQSCLPSLGQEVECGFGFSEIATDQLKEPIRRENARLRQRGIFCRALTIKKS